MAEKYPLSKKSNDVIRKLFNQVRAVPAPLYKMIEPPIFKKPSMYDSIEKSIKTHIENMKKTMVQVELLIKDRIYNIFFISEQKEPIEEYIKMINAWLHIGTLYAKPQCSKQVQVYLYLTDLKKVLPKNAETPIGPEHANTAFTTSCQLKTEIILFRKEEWFKVFIHESFHNLGLDFSSHSDHGRKLLSEIFAVKSEFRLYETYTEMWAELLNIILIHAMSGKTYNKGFIEKDIQAEREFSLYQAAKVLMRGPHTCWEERFANYKENTEAFCYYFLKAVLMYNCNDFIVWVSDNNKPVRTDEEMDQKIEKFINDLIIPKYNEILKIVEKIQVNDDSLRMTKK
jgi:hypothetical protein